MAQAGTDLTPEPGKNDHVRGSLDAPVILTEYADFQCPYCGDSAVALAQILEKYGSKVALVFRHFPLSMHPHAEPAAEAAEAAAKAGKFWEMYDKLFRNQEALTIKDLRAYAEAIGVDADDVENAAAKHEFKARIQRDVTSGEESGVEGTPALFINGYAFDDEPSVEALSGAIDEILGARA